MKYEKFKIANLLKEFIINIDNYLTNFPKKEIELKHKIKDNSYDLLLIIYEGNITTNIKRKQELQEKAIAKVKYIDFLINMCYDKEIINGKKYIKFGEKLDCILRYIVAWKNATVSKNVGIAEGITSRGVNSNSDNANFNVFDVNEGNVNGNNNLCNGNSDNLNENDNAIGVRS